MNSNFLSDNPALNYFKYSPQEKWDFSSYEKNILESDNNYPRATKSRMLSKYKHCLNIILNCSSITDDQKQAVNNLLEAANTILPSDDAPQFANLYNNYGIVGQQGGSITINAAPKRSIDEVDTDEEDADKDEEEEPESSMTDASDDLYLPVRRRPASPGVVGEKLKVSKYILEMREFDDISFVERDTIYYMDSNLCLDERLALSSIKYVHNCPDDDLIFPCELPEGFYAESKNWRKARRTKTDFFPLFFTKDIFFRNLGTFLVNLDKTIDRMTLRYISNDKQSEIDFTVQNVSIFLRFVFDSKSLVNVVWEKTSITSSNTSESPITHDFLFYTKFQEIGCGEIKVNNATEELQEEDQARLGERMKKQLHHRILKAKSEAEFFTFGVFISDDNLELYRCSFSRENGYVVVLLSELTLPTLGYTYNALEESLEILFSFKQCMLNSLQAPSEVNAEYIYRSYYAYFKPTVTFV